jgi:hypothetical protein
VQTNVDRLISARFITPEDGAKLIAEAKQARVPE